MTPRPARNHPNPDHWALIRNERRQMQIRSDGTPGCGTCPVTEGEGFILECHHLHYKTWGAEKIDDVIMLCCQCHEAITSRMRAYRYAVTRQPITIEIPKREPPFKIAPAPAQPISASAEINKGERFRPFARNMEK